jgi:DNA-binding response OmpR family regulator
MSQNSALKMVDEPLQPAKEPDPSARPRRLSILLVEDSIITLELLALFLERRGHAVEVATDGEAGLEMLKARHFDVALLDFHLPKKDGMEVLLEYKRDDGNTAPPMFIGITADVEGLLAHPGNCENFDRIFCKPLSPAELGEAIESVFRHGPPETGALIRFKTAITSLRKADPIPEDGERRTEKRTSVFNASTTLTLQSGETCACEIENVSRGHIAIIVQKRPMLGEQVKIGKTTAWVTRHTDHGIVATWC